ncbi:7-cyano-7-deazaguanine synthase QueC [Haloarculaceae archaeon H-GB2-1]|nr:7-cyano-7-deazaguanine synthase QueC [Haloarculaceae archaeon H-GB1-1]MEA5386730.1 7-cyano-7-deazaguanine synthase QueC [Haloarculaceae archaeon H-GB11]MEA5408256.1 7-cyano-7-deazaguanine synthase QueC [Haloarculaceae archaeon H-GB2-1]
MTDETSTSTDDAVSTQDQPADVSTARTDSTVSAGDEPTDDRAVVLASGGMDSATAAYVARERGFEDLYLLHTSYGQNTEEREYECARALADHLDAADFLHVETGHLAAIGASSLTDDDIAVDDADVDGDEIPTSYVPFRNANLLAMAVSYAEANDCTAVFIGAHSEDFSGYPDCRPAFFDAFQEVVEVGTKPETTISIEAPFVESSKTDIARRGLELGVPYEDTWSCYRENEPACGTCDACAFRLQAFQRLGERDPIPYESRPKYTD